MILVSIMDLLITEQMERWLYSVHLIMGIQQLQQEEAMAAKAETPIKSIRSYCLSCCCNSAGEVRHCPSDDCPLYPYRMGHRPKSITAQIVLEKCELAEENNAICLEYVTTPSNADSITNAAATKGVFNVVD